jgi:hypothetical protein
MSAHYYRKRPVVVEALRYTGENLAELVGWLGASFIIESDGTLTLPTLEGPMTVVKGAYVIRGVRGEYYPCDPQIFAETYDQVDQDQDNAREPQHAS